MARYWVVSPNIGNKNKRSASLKFWIETVLRNRSAYMGWSTDKPMGRRFAEIAPGDLILIAHGPMKDHGANRRLVACGTVRTNVKNIDRRVDDEAPTGHSQYVTLDPFLSLDEDPRRCGIPLIRTSQDGNPQPPAVFELSPDDPNHPGNVELSNWLKKRLGKASATGKSGAKASLASVTANTVSTDGEGNTEEHQVNTKKQMTMALHRENKLVKEFRQALKKKGRDTTRLRYVTGGNTLYCDVYDPDKRHLIEAKGSVSREDIRMAIGQLFDYKRLTQQAGKGKSRLAVLLPERPALEIEQLLKSLKIGVIWKNGRAFSDNCGGALVR